MLLFTDTDSLWCQIETPDLFWDTSENIDLFDTSNFNPDHSSTPCATVAFWGK